MRREALVSRISRKPGRAGACASLRRPSARVPRAIRDKEWRCRHWPSSRVKQPVHSARRRVPGPNRAPSPLSPGCWHSRKPPKRGVAPPHQPWRWGPRPICRVWPADGPRSRANRHFCRLWPADVPHPPAEVAPRSCGCTSGRISIATTAATLPTAAPARASGRPAKDPGAFASDPPVMLDRLHFEPSEHSRCRCQGCPNHGPTPGRLPGSALAIQQIRKPTVCVAAHDTRCATARPVLLRMSNRSSL